MSVDLTSIPEDLQFQIVCESEGQFRCSATVQDRVIENNPAFLDCFYHPHTTATLLSAIRKNPSLIKEYCDVPLPWQEAVLEADIANIWHINNPAPVFKTAFLEHLADVSRSGAEDATDAIKLRAVENNWRAICYIDDPDDDMKWIALKQSWEAIKFIDEPSISQQLVACRSAEGVSFLFNTGNLSDDEEVTALVKKTLLDALTRGTPSDLDSEYRGLFLRLSSVDEVLECLSNNGTEPAFEPRDFKVMPNVGINIKVVQRLGLRKYFVQAQGVWSPSPGLRVFLAGHKDGRLYGYSYLGKTTKEEKGEFIKLLADDSASNDPLEDDEICERAIRQSDVSIIHAAFACIPSPSDAACKAYLAVLAVERGMTSISPLTLDAADDLIRHCPDCRSSLQVAKAASKFNDRLRGIYAICEPLSNDDGSSDELYVGCILKGIHAALDPDACDAEPLVAVGAEDIDMGIG